MTARVSTGVSTPVPPSAPTPAFTDVVAPRFVVPASQRADLLLRRAAALWVVVAAAGQLLFAAYIAGFYGRTAAAGDLAAWGRVMPKGWVAGDPVGNAVIASHLLLAAVIAGGGALQLAPLVRRRAPALHRRLGRVYLLAAVGASAGGLYLVWVRGSVGDLGQHLGISFNAVLIVAAAALAWRAARGRDFAAHRRWALRLYLVANGVWFFRLGVILWLLAWRRPVGFDPDTFAGPFLTALTFAQTLVPLLVLEGYLAARERGGVRTRLAAAAALMLLSVVTAAGVAGVTAVMWLPRLRP